MDEQKFQWGILYPEKILQNKGAIKTFSKRGHQSACVTPDPSLLREWLINILNREKTIKAGCVEEQE